MKLSMHHRKRRRAYEKRSCWLLVKKQCLRLRRQVAGIIAAIRGSREPSPRLLTAQVVINHMTRGERKRARWLGLDARTALPQDAIRAISPVVPSLGWEKFHRRTDHRYDD